ncbi:MAG: alpha/beta hydrolase [Bdellovibrionota bacterium]
MKGRDVLVLKELGSSLFYFLGRTMLVLSFLATLTGCSHLFYQNSHQLYSDPRKAGFSFHEVSFQAKDGQHLYGWYFPAVVKPGDLVKGTIIQFHGNAENMSSHYASLVWVIRSGYNFLTFDYRGYGRNAGDPNQEGVNADAVAAIRYVLDREPAHESKTRDIVLYGQSLGGAVVLRALEEVPNKSRIRAVIVDSAFFSYRAMACAALARSWLTYFFQPLTYLLVSDAYSPEKSIARVSPLPLLVIHGDHDSVVPFELGKGIFERSREPHEFWQVKSGQHIQVMDDPVYRERLLKYLDTR